MSTSSRVLLISLLTFLHASILHAGGWVNFHSNDPAEPEITLLSASDSQVQYRITVPGMWVQDLEVGKETYQLLDYHNGSNFDETEDVPRLPNIPVNIAVPTGSSVGVAISGGRVLYYTGYNVAPVPEVTFNYDHGMAMPSYTYTENSKIYSEDDYYPANRYTNDDLGVFVTQELVHVEVYPILFSPDSSKIEVTDTLTVTVTFSGGSGSAVHDLGIFNGATYGSVINCTDPITPEGLPGNGIVSWVTASQTAITCDYLIIIPDSGVTDNQDPDYSHWDGFVDQVIRFADLRASLSGFDICIAQYGDEANSIQPGPYGSEGEREWEGIRDYIQDVFEDGDAYHTGDGLLKYVLLIGDARDENRFDDPDEDMERDHWLIPSPIGYGCDRMYACLTESSPGAYDLLEDVSIGRFPVGSADELETVVDKMFQYCVTPGDRSWKNNTLGIVGRDQGHFCPAPNQTVCDADGLRDYGQRFHRVGNELLNDAGFNINYAFAYSLRDGEACIQALQPQPEYDNGMEIYWGCAGYGANPADTHFVNSELRDGALFLGYYGHGEENLAFGYKIYVPQVLFLDQANFVSNDDKLHFVLDVSVSRQNKWDTFSVEFLEGFGS
ncbi:hypothetical protein KKH18_10710 [bacterium]|nr:hypothetical protein [bacterium]